MLLDSECGKAWVIYSQHGYTTVVSECSISSGRTFKVDPSSHTSVLELFSLFSDRLHLARDIGIGILMFAVDSGNSLVGTEFQIDDYPHGPPPTIDLDRSRNKHKDTKPQVM